MNKRLIWYRVRETEADLPESVLFMLRHLTELGEVRLDGAVPPPELPGVSSGAPELPAAGISELWMLDSRWYGPLFPLDETAAAMSSKPGEFWGLLRDGRGMAEGFLAVRGAALNHPRLKGLLTCRNPAAALERAGFRGAVYCEGLDLRENRALGYRPELTANAAEFLILNFRLPLLRRDAFAVSAESPVSHGAAIFRALEKARSPYPAALIEADLRNRAPLSWRKNLPGRLLVTARSLPVPPEFRPLKAAVILHVYYPELLGEFVETLGNLPQPFDLFVTTPRPEAAEPYRALLPQTVRNFRLIKTENRGRDIGPWLDAMTPEEHLGYDAVFKLHTKRSDGETEAFGAAWRRFLLDSLLPSPGGTARILQSFADDPELGVVLPPNPPMVALQCPSSSLGSPADAELARELARKLELRFPAETDQPVFPAGSMFCYRPKALEKLFRSGIGSASFPPEPIGRAGTAAHALERLILYIAQSAGYDFCQTMPLEMLCDAFRTYEEFAMFDRPSPGRLARRLMRELARRMPFRRRRRTIWP